jgi:hypothetical protein
VIAIVWQSTRADTDEPLRERLMTSRPRWRVTIGLALVLATLAASCGREAARCQTHRVTGGEVTECQ